MGVSLAKGGNVSLTKQAPGLTSVIVGLGWDIQATPGVPLDLDASALLCGANGRVLSDEHFVFYNNLRSPDGAVEHGADHLTVDLEALPAGVARVVFPVSIYDADDRAQNFGQVRNAFIRIVDRANGDEVARFDLTEDAAAETAVVFGELYRYGSEWKFRAIGHGYASGLRGIALDYGVNV